MSLSLEIKHFIPSYPEIMTPFSVASHAEFSDLAVGAGDEKTGVNGYLPHQELIRRLLSPYSPIPAMLLFHATGTGKGCSSIAVVENFKNMLVDGTVRKPALVLVKNPALGQNYKTEIAEVCVKLNYLPKLTYAERNRLDLPPLPRDATTEERHEIYRRETNEHMASEKYTRRLNSLVATTYQVETFGTFLANFEKNFDTDEKIEEAFNNRVIIVDEVHNLRQGGSGKLGEEDEGVLEESDSTREMYRSLWRLLHVAKNTRTLLLTATPIWDNVREIASLMNLILPEDEQLPTFGDFDRTFFNDDGTLQEENIPTLQKAFLGRVSYLRSSMTTARRREMGITAPLTKFIKVVPCPMSPLQDEIVRELWTPEARKEARDVLQAPRAAANFVFPDGTTDTEGFALHCTVKTTLPNGKIKETYRLKPELAEAMRSITEVRRCSSKFASIIEDILCHKKNLSFVYSQRVSGSGAILLGLILQQYGYTWVKSKADFDGTSKPRFAVITSNVNTTHDRKAILDVINEFNSPANADGSRIQVIIGSETISEGITLKNITRIHVLMPHWNLSQLDQALGRGLRFGSHDALVELKRARGDDSPIEVEIFRHVAVFAKKPLTDEYLNRKICSEKPKVDINTKLDGPDVYVYRLAEAKEFRNVNIYRIMKEEAVDCVLNYKRNVTDGDPDDSRECDFRVCDYTCADVPNKYIKKSGKRYTYKVPVTNFDNKVILYSHVTLKRLREFIKELYTRRVAINFDDMYSLALKTDIPSVNETLLLMALESLIDSREKITDTFGFDRYLTERDNLYSLAVNPNNTGNDEMIYVALPLATRAISLEDAITARDLSHDASQIRDLCSKMTIPKMMDFLSEKTKVVLFEEIFKLSKIRKLPDELKQFITNIHKVGDLFVHILYLHQQTGMSYNASVKALVATGRTRIFENGEWRNPKNESEENDILSKIKGKTSMIEDKKEAINIDAPVFGRLSGEGKKRVMRIIRQRTEDEKKKNRGIVCTTDNSNNIVETLFELKALPDPIANYKTMSMDELMDTLTYSIDNSRSKLNSDMILKLMGSTPSKEKVARVITLANMKRVELCNFLEESFREKGLLIEE